MKARLVFASFFVLVLLSHASHSVAQERWALTAHGPDPQLVATLRTLLADELRGRASIQVEQLADACEDVACSRAAAGKTGAAVAVHVSVLQLGQKHIVSVTAVDVGSGETRFSDRMDAQRVEELDVVAKRMAEAMTRRAPVENTAELGTITEAEADAPVRRSGRFALSLHLGALIPTEGFADRQAGGSIEAGLWFETYDFVIEPRLAVRFDLTDELADYTHVPLELALSYLFSRRDVAPLAGLGVGVGYVHEKIHVERETGTVLVTRTHDAISDDLVGASVFGRLGLLMLRTYDVSMLVTADYGLTFADYQEQRVDQTVRINVGVILGGT
jgi:hypothetical protein